MSTAEAVHIEDVKTEEQPQRTAIIALPPTVNDLINQRKSKRKLTLNDQVEALHLSLWEEEDYQSLLDAVYPEQAITGDTRFDDYEAAKMIQARAVKQGNKYVASQKTAAVVKALNVVLRRYGVSRRERRDG